MKSAKITEGHDCTDLFKKAYQNRYTWNKDFEGYKGKFLLEYDDNSYKGNFFVYKDLKLKVDGINRQLLSLTSQDSCLQILFS